MSVAFHEMNAFKKNGLLPFDSNWQRLEGYQLLHWMMHKGESRTEQTYKFKTAPNSLRRTEWKDSNVI